MSASIGLDWSVHVDPSQYLAVPSASGSWYHPGSGPATLDPLDALPQCPVGSIVRNDRNGEAGEYFRRDPCVESAQTVQRRRSADLAGADGRR